jgi:hypothetical protein
MDYTALVAAVDWSAALTAIGTVAVAAAGLFIGIRGARTVLGFIRR